VATIAFDGLEMATPFFTIAIARHKNSSGLPLHQVGAEIPIDSDDADEANLNDNGRTLLYVFSRGCSILLTCTVHRKSPNEPLLTNCLPAQIVSIAAMRWLQTIFCLCQSFFT
jgi:hypothetical protein